MAELGLAITGILITALQHHDIVSGPAMSVLRWKYHQSKATACLMSERATYQQNLILMLDDAVSPQDLRIMIDDPHSHLWKEPTLKDDLKRKLGRAYTPVTLTIDAIIDTMGSMADILDLQGSDNVTQEGLEAIVLANAVSDIPLYRQRPEIQKRLRFAAKRGKLERRISKLAAYNASLYGFLQKEKEIRGISPGDHRVSLRFAAPLQSIQENASRVHRVLHQSWCNSHDSHQASLLLEPRVKRKRRRLGAPVPATGRADCFGVSLWRVADSTWLDAEFSVDEYNMAVSGTPSIPRVSFSVSESISSLEPSTTRLGGLEITDLCSTAQRAAHPLVGFYLDSSEKLRGLYQVQSQPRRLGPSCVTLAQLLPSLKTDMSERDRRSLVLTLVCSVLQLGGTPWLDQPWNKDCIAFLRLLDFGESSVDIINPYLTSKPCPPKVSATNPSQLHRRNILALGIMLLEINQGSPIENHRQERDLGPDGKPNEMTDFTTLLRCQQEQTDRGHMSNGEKAAILHCLTCFMDNHASFSHEEFLTALQEQILEPLEQEMEQMYG